MTLPGGVSAAIADSVRIREPLADTARDDRVIGDRVILVHGTLDDATSFRRVAAKLPGWTVVTYDRRGWGASRSNGGTGTTLLDHVEDLCSLVEALPGSVVAGHSYGGLVTLCAAAKAPEAVRSAFAYEPPVRWLPWWPSEAPWEKVVRQAADKGPAAAAEALLRSLLGDAVWDRLPDKTRKQRLELGDSLVTEMIDETCTMQVFDPVEVSVGVLVGSGSDSLPHHREVSRRLAALFPNGEFVELADAGHGAHLSHRGPFAELVERAGRMTGRLGADAPVSG